MYDKFHSLEDDTVAPCMAPLHCNDCEVCSCESCVSERNCEVVSDITEHDPYCKIERYRDGGIFMTGPDGSLGFDNSVDADKFIKRLPHLWRLVKED